MHVQQRQRMRSNNTRRNARQLVLEGHVLVQRMLQRRFAIEQQQYVELVLTLALKAYPDRQIPMSLRHVNGEDVSRLRFDK